ncbi:DUF6907 domain-containing protein [Streptomyces tendae]|uniref:DUF6907 domain-containing protein n=1 Tax=Streptomyces tendae TaxID=1932 RepID=UPI0036FA5915
MTVTLERPVTTPTVRRCPAWCDGQHNADRDGNFFHRGPIAVAAVPDSAAGPTGDSDPAVPALTAHLVLPAGPEFDGEPAQITVDNGDLFGPYAELNLAQADAFLRDLKVFTARVQQMHDRLVELNGGRP